MKVICIDSSTDPGSELQVNVIEGRIYTVVDEQHDQDGIWYELEEMGNDSVYSSDGFIPLSQIDETQLVNRLNAIH